MHCSVFISLKPLVAWHTCKSVVYEVTETFKKVSLLFILNWFVFHLRKKNFVKTFSVMLFKFYVSTPSLFHGYLILYSFPELKKERANLVKWLVIFLKSEIFSAMLNSSLLLNYSTIFKMHSGHGTPSNCSSVYINVYNSLIGVNWTCQYEWLQTKLSTWLSASGISCLGFWVLVWGVFYTEFL